MCVQITPPRNVVTPTTFQWLAQATIPYGITNNNISCPLLRVKHVASFDSGGMCRLSCLGMRICLIHFSTMRIALVTHLFILLVLVCSLLPVLANLRLVAFFASAINAFVKFCRFAAGSADFACARHASMMAGITAHVNQVPFRTVHPNLGRHRRTVPTLASPSPPAPR